MDAAAILDLADLSTRLVRRRFSLVWTHEDTEDARQEAAAGILRALRDAPGKPRAYYVRAGEQAVIRFVFRRPSVYAEPLVRADGTEREDGETIESSHRGWNRPLTDDELPAIRALLVRAIRKSDARGGPKTRDQVAAARDLMILVGLSEGLSQSQIGELLGLPKGHIHKYQQQIRQRLAAIAEEYDHDAAT
jgi:DNA-directed RNA polymerase specialized sigma24 family protein